MKKTGILLIGMLLFSLTGGEVIAKNKLHIGLRGVGGRLSLLKPDEVSTALGLGIHADFGDLAPSLAWYPSMTYLNSSLDVITRDFSVSEFGFNSDVHYYFPASGNVSPYLGGGLGLFITNVENLDSELDLGLNFLGGLETRLAPNLKGFLQARYKIDGIDTVSLTGGLTFKVTPKSQPATARESKKEPPGQRNK